MRVLISGICGFVGSALARAFAEGGFGHELLGIDNLVRPGSETNRNELKRVGARVFHGDLRCASDFESLPDADWIIDAAANPSVLAGVDGRSSSRQVVEHNLVGTVNMLEFCKSRRAGFTLLSTSRVYSVAAVSALPLDIRSHAFRLRSDAALPDGATAEGITERFPTEAPVSLYGATKLASEALALEYGCAFEFPVFINRCGVLAGAGQFGRPDQGILAYWIHSWARKRPLHYVGFGGSGHQVRDFLHPRDLIPALQLQFAATGARDRDARVANFSGGIESAMSLRELSDWCATNLGPHSVGHDGATRRFDVPWLVLDSGKARRLWNWQPATRVPTILEEIARHARGHPDWLDLSAPP